MYGFYGEKLHDNHFWEIRGERESKILKSTCCISSNYNSDILFDILFDIYFEKKIQDYNVVILVTVMGKISTCYDR